jgi:endonuclease III
MPQNNQSLNNHIDKKKNSFELIREDVLSYYNILSNEPSITKEISLEECAKKFILENPNAFLFALIAEQSVKTEVAWSLPYNLKERLGHFDIYKIADYCEEEFEVFFKTKPALHRYPGTISKYILSACKTLIEKYSGSAYNIWKHPSTANEIIARLNEFKGISQKKATLGALLLIRDFMIEVEDKNNVDIAFDVHVKRVFLRSGLVNRDDLNELVNIGRILNPEYPGVLTTPFWNIGRNWCRPTNPNCSECPIKRGCLKKINSFTR